MEKITAASDIALARLVQALDSDVRKGLIVGMGLAVLFLWGP